MENNEKKKPNIILIIIIAIIILALIIFAIWFFLLRDKGGNNTANNNGGSSQNEKKPEDKPTDKKGYEYDYRDGVLTAIVDEDGNPKQTDFVIDGIILIGNRHEYFDTDDTDTIINNFVKQGYKKEGINSSFYLNEWIELYIDTKYTGSASDVKILITPHKEVADLEELSLAKLEELATENGGYIIDYNAPETDNHKYVGNGYVNSDYPEGKYDILFIYKGKLAYFININETKEPTE
jgi:hypothetical protein